MCTDTFLRLPEEKRTRFLDAAWEEFGRVKFGDVSINQIIRRAGIPRGSFYQYFAGKEELFDYLVLDVQARFVETFRTLLEQKGGDLFQLPTAIFDLIVDQVGKPIPILDRCLRLFQVNPGIDLRRLIAGRLDQDPPPARGFDHPFHAGRRPHGQFPLSGAERRIPPGTAGAAGTNQIRKLARTTQELTKSN